MPKIFLIKNRLHQQQLRLQEQQSGQAGKNDLGIGEPQPLSLIVERKEEGKEISTMGAERNPRARSVRNRKSGKQTEEAGFR